MERPQSAEWFFGYPQNESDGELAASGGITASNQTKRETKMKNLIKSLSVLALALAFAGTAYAGACCTKAADKAKKGETCAKCETTKCCQDAVKKLGDKAKPCAACAKAKEKA